MHPAAPNAAATLHSVGLSALCEGYFPTKARQELFYSFLPSMAIKKSQKKTLITKHRTHNKDTGSPQVQIAILTKEIGLLTDHLKDHKKDHSARRGLLGKVAQRRKLLTYLRMNKPEQYQEVLEKHKLKK